MVIVLACVFLGLCAALAAVVMKKTMIDEEPESRTALYVVTEKEDGEKSVHPLH